MLALLVNGLVQMAAPAQAQAVALVYPNLRTLPPRDLRFSTATIDGSMHNVLKFSNTVLNDGPGKLEIHGQIDPVTRNGPAVQRVYDDVRTITSYSAGNFAYHDVHDHYHYDGWGKYELWSQADYDRWLASGRAQGQARKVGTKTTSCILDEEFIKTLPTTPYPEAYDGAGCHPGSDNILREGLSPGWGDTYDYYRYEQWIDLDQTPLQDGTYVLRSVTDPNNQIYESSNKADSTVESQIDNEATTTFTVSSGYIVDTSLPTGTVMINDVAAVTAANTVTVKTLGRDDVSGVDSFRLSNDGYLWKTYPYAPDSSRPTSVAWNLTDPAYGGNSSKGLKTVRVQFHDAAGKWGLSEADTIEYAPVTAPPVTSNYAKAVLADGPVGYWRLGEGSGSGAADSAGAHVGTYLGSPTLGEPSLVPSETGDASVGLQGTQARVGVPDAADLRFTDNVSLEAWIRPTSLPAAGDFASLVSKPNSYSLQFNGPRLEFTLIQSGGARQRLQAPAGTVVAGATYHVVGTYDGTSAKLYLNGALAASFAVTGAVSASTTDLTIGSWSGPSEFFTGRIDDVAVYPKVLASATVAAHHSTGTDTGTPGPYPVTVAAAGTGTGKVTSSPAGIDCPTTCTAQFPTGQQLTLSATAASTSTFTGWSGAGCSGTNTCTFTPTASTTVTATFTKAPPVTSNYAKAVLADGPVGYWRLGEGSGSGAADSAGAHVGTYLGSPTLGEPSLVPSETGDASVGLQGTQARVGVPDAADLRFTDNVSLEAWIRPTSLPAAGDFASLVSKPNSYSLQFNGPRLEFTLIQSGGARQRLQAPAGTVVAGATYHVVGTYDGTSAKLYLNGALAASFAVTGAVSASTTDLTIGSWSGPSEFFTGRIDDVAVYPKVLASATVAAHHSTGTDTGTPGPYPVTVAAAGTGTGKVTSSPAGIDCPTTCTAQFPTGQQLTLSATAASTSTFTGWSGAGCSGTNTCTFTPTASTTVTATFDSRPTTAVAVSLSGSGAGIVTSTPKGITCPSTCNEQFPVAQSVTLQASPSVGSTFVGWTGGSCSGTSMSCTFSPLTPTSVTAMFDRQSGVYALSVSRAGGGDGTVSSAPAGIDCGSVCAAPFPADTMVLLTASPSPGVMFAGWGGACSGTNTTCSVAMTSARTVSAAFLPLRKLTVTTSGRGSGRVSSSPAGVDCGATCTATFPTGTTVTLAVAPSAGSVFKSWTGGCAGRALSCTFVISADSSVTATFR